MMSKGLCFSIFFVLVLTLASASYGNSPFFKLDFDEPTDVNTEPGFTSFLLEDSGSEVNGITIELLGNLDTCRRPGPNQPDGDWYHELYRDFIFAYYPDGIEMTLWGLGAGRKCDITIYAFDAKSSGTRVANWSTPTEPSIIQTWFNGNFGDILQWPYYLCGHKECYAFTGTGTADELGRIILTSTIDPCSQENEPFAYVNALIVSPNSTGPAYIPVEEATIPQPVNGQEDVSIDDVVLSWKAGAFADKHDVYLGTNKAAVTDANRSNPLGVLVSQDHSTTTYTPPSFLDLNSTFYWRIDEVNDPNIWKGEVWSFKTVPYFVVEDFDSYEDDSALWNVWKDGGTNGTGAEVSVETAIVRDGNSMRYRYKNNLWPYYSEADVNIADLGIDDPNWLGIGGAEALVLRFHVEPNAPFSEQMYVKLTDGDSPANTTTVTYSDTANIWLTQWNEWSIALTEFTDVNLANVARITIGFGDGSPGDVNIVYFDDITLGEEIPEWPEVTGEVDVNTVYQQLEGFGGSACYDAGALAYHPNNVQVYDLLFRDLGMDVLRIKNTYDISSSEIIATGLIVKAARQPTRNPNLKLLLVPWSPALYLKSDPCNLGAPNSTLKKDANDPNNSAPYYYVYKAYADWWYYSLLAWEANGVEPEFISIQNEPDWGYQDQVCRFTPTENSTYAGYDKAFEAVYNRIDGNVSPMPKMLAPESVGFGSSRPFINALDDIGQINNVYGFSHHLYGDGSYNNPDGMITEPGYTMQEYADDYGYKPLFQTEYGQPEDPPTFDHAVLMAQHIHNCLVYEGVTSYYQWTSFRNGSYTTGGMINLNSGSNGYIVRDLYWFFKAYAYFTDPNWYRIGATSSPSSDLRMTAFKNPDSNQLTIVILNKSAIATDLMLTVNGFSPSSSEIYRSSETEHWLYLGTYRPSLTLPVPAYSITTIHMTGTVFSNCSEVLVAGYGLTSDIHDDCYVDFKDLGVVAKYWLNTNCASQNDCEGADFEPLDGDVDYFDLGTFVQQWLWCNDPEDPDCTANW